MTAGGGAGLANDSPGASCFSRRASLATFCSSVRMVDFLIASATCWRFWSSPPAGVGLTASYAVPMGRDSGSVPAGVTAGAGRARAASSGYSASTLAGTGSLFCRAPSTLLLCSCSDVNLLLYSVPSCNLAALSFTYSTFVIIQASLAAGAAGRGAGAAASRAAGASLVKGIPALVANLARIKASNCASESGACPGKGAAACCATSGAVGAE